MMEAVHEYEIKPLQESSVQEPDLVTGKQTMSFGSQDKVKSPTSRVLKKIADSENNINNLYSSPIDNKERPEFENVDSMI
jgi:hypothetical protein